MNSITLPVPTKPRTKPGRYQSTIPYITMLISITFEDLISAILQDPKVFADPIASIASIHNLVHEVRSYSHSNHQF